MKKIGALLIIFLALTTLLSSQSLVEFAKKEKERRAKLKAKAALVITNQNITKYTKNPAVATKAGTTGQSQTQQEGERDVKSPLRREGGEPAIKILTQKSDPAELQMDLEKAQEYVELLSLKMNALWQEFYSMDDMTSRDSIQQQIDSTYKQLQKAQADEEALKKKVSPKK